MGTIVLTDSSLRTRLCYDIAVRYTTPLWRIGAAFRGACVAGLWLLLGWFPADHRAVHGEEMLGVLMAAAGDGRDKPGLPETADLLLGAARIRLR